MTKQLYLNDHESLEFKAKVISVNGTQVELDQTMICPEGGGQPSDEGFLIRGAEQFNILRARKEKGKIIFEVDKEGLSVGDDVDGFVDGVRRKSLMRSHTAAHVISGYFSKELGALITGNQLSVDGGRIDFNLEAFDKEALVGHFTKCNEIIKRDLPVKVYWKSREEVENDPSLCKLAMGLPAGINELRIVDIVGFDAQPDGGTHVSHLVEIGRVEFVRADNKGKNNRRVYFKIVD